MRFRILPLLILITFCLLPLFANAATYNYYFSYDTNGTQVGNDSMDCTDSAYPCQSLSRAQQMVNNANSGDIVNLYFEGGDTWTEVTGASVPTTAFGLSVDSNDPIVNIASYGSGKAIFNGSVSDFSTASYHSSPGGPLLWSTLFHFNRDNCSISNVEMKNIYGRAITVKAADNFRLSNCKIHNFGSDAIYIDDGSSGSVVEKNVIYQGQQLWRYKLRPNGWGAAISIQDYNYTYSNNTVRHNLVYDIYGEGIIVHGGTVEYNVVGDTYSVAIYYNGKYINGNNFTVRYNYIISSNSNTYRVLDGRTSYNGIGWVEEREGGSNTGASVEIYGNIVINRYYGIYMKNTYSEPLGSAKIYNNTVIDCSLANYNISNPENVTDAGYIYNNASMLYKRTNSDHDGINTSLPNANWAIDSNGFWTSDASPIVDDGWTTHYNIENPKLPGEQLIDWTNLTGSTYYNSVNFNTHLYLPPDSGLVKSAKTLGAGYETKFLTYGTDFSSLPNPAAFRRASQPDTPTIGAIVRSSDTNDISPPNGLTIRLLE